MDWHKLGRKEASGIYSAWKSQADVNFVPVPDYNNEYAGIRNAIESSWQKATEHGFQKSQRMEYQRDLAIGLAIYHLFTDDYEMTPRAAANDDIWRYISMKVLPDIVWKRWGDNPERFFQGSTRLWPKTLFWFIHLSWQGDISGTENLLFNFSTDDIVQLVERTGTNGYRVNLYRAIMKQYYLECVDGRKNKDMFRKVMKLNTALVKVIEPEFFGGGVEEYAKMLFAKFE
jgi:hypothetical protein